MECLEPLGENAHACPDARFRHDTSQMKTSREARLYIWPLHGVAIQNSTDLLVVIKSFFEYFDEKK